jgi:hypothetical protein
MFNECGNISSAWLAWGVTVGIRAGFRSLGVKVVLGFMNNLEHYLVLTKI